MPSTPPTDLTINLGLSTLLAHASLPVLAVVIVLLAASTSVWIVGVLKVLQVGRLRARARAFEQRAHGVRSAADLISLVRRARESAGVRVLQTMLTRGSPAATTRLRAVADRAIVDEGQRAKVLMPVLASIGAAAPFVGLFGTVYGIMDAFARIGAARSASLPVVAPAIGEALITTAIGLAAAIPAVLFYNLVDKQISDFLAEVEASAAEWIVILAVESQVAPLAAPLADSDEPG